MNLGTFCGKIFFVNRIGKRAGSFKSTESVLSREEGYNVSVLGREERYKVKYIPLLKGVPEGEARGNS